MKGGYLLSYLIFHAIDKSHRIWFNHIKMWSVWQLAQSLKKARAPFFDSLNLQLFQHLEAGICRVSVNTRKLPPDLIILPGERGAEVLNVNSR